MPRPPQPLPIRITTPDAAAASAAAPLDDLLQRIAAQRGLLAAWQSARDAAHVRYARDIAPLHDDYCALMAQQVQRLDVASASPGLSRADRATLRGFVAELAGELAEASRSQSQRAAMQDIHRRHAEATAQPPDDDAVTPDNAAAPPDEAAAPYAIDEGSDEEQPADWEGARAAAEQRRAAHHAARRSRTRAGQLAPAVPSLREVYRRVASALHPDREPDPAARERKNALMQQANRAYAAQDLLGLLQLLGNGALPPAAALAPYRTLLTTQLAALQREVAAAAQAFCDEFGVEGAAGMGPDKAMALLRGHAQQLRDAIAWQRAALAALPTDADGVRRWLREERAARHSAVQEERRSRAK